MSNCMNTLSFVKSNKGHRQLVRNGYIYKLNRQTSTKMYWICKHQGCTATVHIDKTDNYLQSNGEHNHLIESEELEVQRFRIGLKDRVINETAPIPKIFDEEIAKARFSSNALANVPMFRDIQPGLNQARRKLTPSLPGSISFDIPDSYRSTACGEKFLVCDTLVGRKKRLLIFASPKQLELLFNSSILFMDGTFSSTPPHFDQVFIMHVLKFESSLPCCFGLLPDRKKSTYQQLFQELKGVAVSMNRIWKPERIITDFEPSLISAIPAEFPDAIHQGCFFHHNQALYQRIQSLGLATAYAEDDEIRSFCRKLMALPMLPLDVVETSFYQLRTALNNRQKEELRQLFLYYNDYWMNKVPINMWNVHGCQHRTNNVCYHNRLNRRLERAHANIWTFIRCIASEESRFQHFLIQLETGAQRRAKTNATDAIQKRVDALNERYEKQEIDAENLLCGLALLVDKK
ncbi:unnamed protein product [Adineta ricciae]|uniref:MULE transposase domain-containing protein n=1 Tax=Adineta ricciae TaxID=249248 RepID=A0A814ZP24_ADIRI|nr:unnamed protein product [Adineta ricciae]